MKKWYLGGFVVFICVLLLFATSSAVFAATVSTEVKDIMTVSGQGKVTLMPDMAYVTVEINTEAKTAMAAQAGNNQMKAKAVAALTALGISNQEILNLNYNISPKFDYVTKGQTRQVYVSSYKAVSKLQVTVSDINNVGRVLDAVINAGANLSGDVMFSVSKEKMDKAYDDALTAAVNDAVRKAQLLAKSLNVSFGKPIEISEGGANQQGVSGGNATVKNGDGSAASGQFDVTASVNLRYEY